MQITQAIVRVMLGSLAGIMLVGMKVALSGKEISKITKGFFIYGFATEVLALMLLWK